MSTDARCEQTRALVPELALGLADGRERAEALTHIATCSGCRRLLEELTELADELLLLAPAHEPPPGFESAVLESLAPRPPHRRRLARPLVVLATALTAAAVATAATYLSLRDERHLASQYRAALERVGGDYFEAAELRTVDGATAGKVFGYQGRPSWLLVIVYRDFRGGSFSAEAETAAGRRVVLRGLDVTNGAWGGALAIPLRDVALVRLRSDDGSVFEAHLPRP
jgi:hypothetical protein